MPRATAQPVMAWTAAVGASVVYSTRSAAIVASAGSTAARSPADVPASVAVDGLDAVLPAGAVRQGDRIEFATTEPTAAVHAVTGWAVAHGIELGGLAVSRPSLEDVYLQLAGEDVTP